MFKEAMKKLEGEYKSELNALKDELSRIKENNFTFLENEVKKLRVENAKVLEAELVRLKEDYEKNALRGIPAWGKSLYSTAVKQPEEVSYVVNAAKIELKEAEKRARNVIIFGLPMSTKDIPAERKQDDLEEVRAVLADTGSNVIPLDIYRFEENQNRVNKKPPPILVECKTEEDKMKVIRMAKNLRNKENRVGVFINRDLTPSERDYSKKLSEHRNEFDLSIVGARQGEVHLCDSR